MTTMNMNTVNDIQTQTDALDQSLALNRITTQLLEERNKDFKRLRMILLISILCNLIIVCIFLFQQASLTRDYRDLLDSLEWEETTTTTTEIIQDTDGPGNNTAQIGDNSQIIYGESEDEVNGKTNDTDYQNDNQG